MLFSKHIEAEQKIHHAYKKRVYSDRHTTADRYLIKNFNLANFCKQDYFFWPDIRSKH